MGSCVVILMWIHIICTCINRPVTYELLRVIHHFFPVFMKPYAPRDNFRYVVASKSSRFLASFLSLSFYPPKCSRSFLKKGSPFSTVFRSWLFNGNMIFRKLVLAALWKVLFLPVKAPIVHNVEKIPSLVFSFLPDSKSSLVVFEIYYLHFHFSVFDWCMYRKTIGWKPGAKIEFALSLSLETVRVHECMVL